MMQSITFKRALTSAIATLAFASAAHAAKIEYLVNIPGSANSSITGSITTDGALGQIGASNLVDWQITLNDGVSSFTLTHDNSSIWANSTLIASNTSLSFDFSSRNIALFQNPYPGSGINYWCLDGVTGGCSGVASSINWRVSDGRISSGALSGVQSIAVTAVPEPATYAIMGAGLALLGVAARRKKPV